MPNPETPSKQSEISAANLGPAIDLLPSPVGFQTPEAMVAHLAATLSPEDLIAMVRQQSEDANKAKQSAIAVPPAMPDADWQARRAWLLDAAPIYGELKTFFWPALIALQANDQAEYSRQRDLLFKALHTFLGDPPSAPQEVQVVAAPELTKPKPQ